MEFTTLFGLHSQTIRLEVGSISVRRARPDGAITLSGAEFRQT
jgi:hypothetical protein